MCEMGNSCEENKNKEELYQKKFYQLGKGRNRFGVSSRGVYLAAFELQILTELAQYKLLNTKHLQILHEKYQAVKEDSLRKKLNRWHEKDVIHKVDLGKRLGFGNDLNVFRISVEGIRILIQEKYLSDKFLDVKLTKIDKIRNIDHFLATNQLVLQTELAIDKKWFEFEKANYRNKINQRYGVISDAIININNLVNNTLVYIETDMGTESISELHNKIKRYATIARDFKQYVHVVFIALIDHSYQTRKYYEIPGDRRIANIKKYDIYNKDVFQPNLKIVIAPFRQVPDVIYEIVIDSFNYGRELYLSDFIGLFKEKENLNLRKIDDQFVYSNDILKIHRKYFQFYEVYNRAGTIIDRIGVTLMNVNSINESIVMNNMINYMTKGKFNKPITKMIVVYLSKADREADTHGITYLNSVLFTDLETMNELTDERYFVSISPYKKKRITFI